MLLNILKISKLVMQDEAETGSAGKQPVRNSPADWNIIEVGSYPTSSSLNIPVIYALKTHCSLSLIHIIFFSICSVCVEAVQNN